MTKYISFSFISECIRYLIHVSWTYVVIFFSICVLYCNVSDALHRMSLVLCNIPLRCFLTIFCAVVFACFEVSNVELEELRFCNVIFSNIGEELRKS